MNICETKKKSKGRKKIEIKRIEKEENRQVCFTKRRQGLFKKANELSILCGAEVGIAVFSLAGKLYSFGHPSVDHAFRFLEVVPTTPSLTFPTATNCCEPMNPDLVSLQENLEAELKRREALQEALKKHSKPFWWDVDLQSMGIDELREFGNVLLEYQAIVSQEIFQQNSFQPSDDAPMDPIECPPPVPQVEEPDYFLWLQQQQDLGFDGYDCYGALLN